MIINNLYIYFHIVINFIGDLFEKEEDILNPFIWKELGTKELQKVQSHMRSYIINLANFIIPGHGPMFVVTNDMKRIIKNQIII